jgi:ubiquinone/menaquinone biosynthesis C-methylase UbiE
MLAIAQRRLSAHPQIELRQLNAESMPSVPDASVDAYSISLALKICNFGQADGSLFWKRPTSGGAVCIGRI